MEQAIEQRLIIAPEQATELQRALNASQPTISRALGKLEKKRRILRIGKARATRYAAIRSVPLLSAELPVYEVNAAGEADRIAALTPVYPNHFAVVAEKRKPPQVFPVKEEILPSLPFYLQALRPEGFLGRLIAAEYRDSLRAPEDLRLWHEDHVLAYAALFGGDLPGAFVVGENAIGRFLEAKPSAISGTAALVHEAEKIESGEPVGSSAGGEQPKFTAFVCNEGGAKPVHAIVKFSSAAKNAAAERWRDLLICEHIALETIRQAKLPAASTRLATGVGRVFLVVERFDRIGAKGRRHYFSFAALDDALHGDRRDIRKSALFFYENNFISQADYEAILLISLFGDAIGNTDQHFGNTSFTWQQQKFALAPAYDVLPMWYAPRSQGTIVEGLHPLKPIFPEYKTYKARVSEMAATFWKTAAEHRGLSPGFRRIAKQNLDRSVKN